MADIGSAERQQLWRSLTRAVDVDLRDATSIRGISGLEHPVQAVGVDEKAKRMVVISAEANARIAALMQVDVQQAMPEYKLIVARPIIVDIGVLSRRLFDTFPTRVPMGMITAYTERQNSLSNDERQEEMKSLLSDVLQPVIRGWKNAKLPTAAQVLDIVGQATRLDWDLIIEKVKAGTTDSEIDLTAFSEIDSMVIDREHGICPIPLFEFTEKDWDVALNNNRVDELRERLRRLDVLQFFYPPPDQVALGIIASGGRNEQQVLDGVGLAPALGHPFSEPDLIPTLAKFTETVDALKASGHVVTGEFGLELSDSGKAIRASVSIRPKESLIHKILN